MVTAGSERQQFPISEETASQWIYLAPRPHLKPEVGVSLSGGGIRSAGFSMGAMQRLQHDGVLDRVDHLAAVSGGTYLAGGASIISTESDQDLIDGFPWSHGSPEERRLRLETTYLSSGLRDTIWLVSNYAYGLILNILTLSAATFLVGRLVGTILTAFTNDTGELTDTAIGTTATLGFCSAVLMVSVVGIRRFFDKPNLSLNSDQIDLLRYANLAAFTIAAACALLPALAYLLHAVADPLDRITGSDPNDDLVRQAALRAASGTAAMAMFAAFGSLAIWFARRSRLGVLLWPIAAIAGPGLLLTPALLAADTAFSNRESLAEQTPELLLSVAGVLLCSVFAHNRRYSLHLFYRERLHRSFAIERKQDENGTHTARSVPYEKELLLSNATPQSNGVSMPNIIYCAAVAADRNEAPYRRNAGSYTFETDWSGGPLVGYVPTSDLEGERVAGGTELTLPSVMAISGAAISPLMGRLSEPTLRFLLAMLNLRLGVWLPHPAAYQHQRTQTTSENEQRPDDTEPEDSPTQHERQSLVRRSVDYLWGGWKEPGSLYVLFEALGMAKTGGNYVYVTDGGHWENLGLVELLRRRCSHVIVIDASAPGTDLDEELARAAALANAELGVELTVDLEGITTPQDRDDRLPDAPFAVGTIAYPDGQEGRFIFVRSMLWKDAPFESLAFQRQDSQFPHHPTTNQFFSGDQFDAYRRLGWAAAAHVAPNLPIPPPLGTGANRQRLQT